MIVKFDDKEALMTLKNARIEVNNKPMVMRGTFESGKNLHIIVDMVKGFVEEGLLSFSAFSNLIPHILGISEKVKRVENVFIRDCHAVDSVEFKFFPEHCHTSKQSKLVKGLRGLKGLDITKNCTNSFFNLITNIPNILDYQNIIVSGVCSDICVMQLALTLRAYINEFNKTGNVIVFTDCVDTYDSNIHNQDIFNMMAIKLMEQSGVQIFKNIL